MKATWKESTDGTQWQIILEAQNATENAVLQDMFQAGAIRALGETNRGRAQLYLSMRVPDWYREERRG